ncbi:DC-STAMP domain-containing protein 2-like [Lycorma delicatula]|uniref:DC-STAMP domain-containing protein 2-like n=1 Tax=Lycorma delicatula TaxID=130591 RepID=UPI003F51AA7C
MLAVMHPLQNTLINVDALSENLACKQELIHLQLNRAVRMLTQPGLYFKDKLGPIRKTLNVLRHEIENAIKYRKQILFEMLESLSDGMDWLETVFNTCLNKFGTPFGRCMKVFDDNMNDCVVIFIWLQVITDEGNRISPYTG